MPVLLRDDISPAPDIPKAATRSKSRIWITVAIVGGGILLATAFVTAVVVYFRRREYRRAKRDDPALSHKGFLRRNKMTAVARQTEEELQRRIIIRKSLVSKSTEWSITRSDSQSLDVIDEHDGSGLKEDWKEWEARMQRERPDTMYRHPSETAVLPDLPLPTKSKSPSPSRSPLLTGLSPSLVHECPD